MDTTRVLLRCADALRLPIQIRYRLFLAHEADGEVKPRGDPASRSDRVRSLEEIKKAPTVTVAGA